jgi:flagellar biosynthetic protein FliP
LTPTLFSLLLLLGIILGLGAIRAGLVLLLLQRALSGVPPASITLLLALLLSGLHMAPVAARCQQALRDAPRGADADPLAAISAGLAPLREHLRARTPQRDRAAVLELARAVQERGQGAAAAAPQEDDLAVLAPAFALAELRLSFQIGFLLLLPFLVLDLLVAALLQGLLLPGLSARMVALPFKLLLFVLCDGWQLLTRGLLLSGGG